MATKPHQDWGKVIMLIVQSNSRTTTASKLLDTNQLAEQLLNKSNTIEGWRIKGVGPRYIKIGRLVRYRPEDVELWLEAQTRNSTSLARN